MNGLNSRSIPTTTWMLMEIIKDPALLKAVRDEVATLMLTDLETGKRTLDSQNVVALPLLQSLWTETLRLRTNFNIGRAVKQAITLDGHTISRGSILQAPMIVAHYDEAVWSAADHSASDFWAERHIKYTDEVGQTKRIYAMAGRPTSSPSVAERIYARGVSLPSSKYSPPSRSLCPNSISSWWHGPNQTDRTRTGRRKVTCATVELEQCRRIDT